MIPCDLLNYQNYSRNAIVLTLYSKLFSDILSFYVSLLTNKALIIRPKVRRFQEHTSLHFLLTILVPTIKYEAKALIV